MTQAAVLASTKYGDTVHGSNAAVLREARSWQARVQGNRLAGKNATLFLALSDKPLCDPAYQSKLDPLLAHATA
eukprot:6179600-Pyramimonas_sp.AAC.1